MQVFHDITVDKSNGGFLACVWNKVETLEAYWLKTAPRALYELIIMRAMCLVVHLA